MKTLFAALSMLLFLTLGACNSSKDNIVCDANGCRNTNTVSTVGTTGGCFINSAGLCSSSMNGITCLTNSVGQCVPSNQTNCTAFDQFGNCISGGILNSCQFRDRFGNCLPSLCRVVDIYGRCVFYKGQQ